MSSEKSKWTDAVVKIIKLTQNSELKWQVAEPTEEIGKTPDDRITAVFSTSHKSKNLRLYERVYQVRVPNPFWAVLSEPTFRWRTNVVLEITDLDGLAVWTFPNVASLRDLLATVQYQVANIKDFLDAILTDSEQETT